MKGLAVSAAVLVFVLLFAKPTTSQGTTQTCEAVLRTVQNLPTACATASTSNCVQNITANTCSCCKQAAASDACCTGFLTATRTYSQTCNNVQVSADLSSLATIVKDCASSAAAHVTFIGSGLMGLVAMLIWLLL